MDDRQKQLSAMIVLSLAVLSAFVIRCFSFRNFINPEGGFYFYSIDSYDHLRRITLGAQIFPKIPSFDYYAAYPQGLGQIWAPLFDYLLAGLCRLGGGSRELIETICFFFNPFLAVLTVVLVYRVARLSFQSAAAGAAAALLLALSPGHISYSIPMNFDHHATEPVIVLLLFSLPFFEREGTLRPLGKILAGLMIVGAIFMWRGSSLYWGMVFLSVFLRCIIEEKKELAAAYAIVFFGCATVLSLYCLADPWGGADEISFGVISWFHVIALGCWASILLLYRLSGTRKVYLLFFGGVVVVFGVLAVGPLRGLIEQIAGGLSFIRGQGDPWLEINSELRSVFSARHSSWFSAGYLTPFWFLVPVAAGFAFKNLFREKQHNPYLINFMVWVPLFAMGLVIRYTHVAGVFVSLAGGYLFSLAWRAAPHRRLKSIAVASFILLVLPGIPHYKNTMAGYLPSNLKYGMYGDDGVLSWLKANTPQTSYYLAPTTKPEYGVLARWSMGARIYHVAERPVMSTAFGWETHGFYQEAGFWVAENPADADRIIQDNGIKYIVVKARHDLKSDFMVSGKGEAEGVLPAGLAGQNYQPELTMYGRLLWGDGGAMRLRKLILPALEGYRLVYESWFLAQQPGAGSSGLSYYKIFEVVPGAVLQGKVDPGLPVVISLSLLTSRNRVFEYHDRRIAGKEDGLFSFRLPYATSGIQGDSRPQGPYVLRAGGRAPVRVSVSEADVVQGGTIELDSL